MKRAHVVSVATCLLAVMALPAQAVLLRYNPKVGVATKHKFTMAGRTEVTAPGMPEAMQMEMEAVMHSVQKALSETADTVRVETRLLDSNVKMTMGGQTHAQPVPEIKIVAKIDRRGRTVKVEEADMGDSAVSPQMMAGGPETWGNWSSFSAFPEKDVKAGAKWSDELSMGSVPGMEGMTIKSTSEVLALTTFQGRKCAKMRTVFEAPLDFDLSEMAGTEAAGMEGSMEGLMNGTMLWYYDYENSVYAYAEGTIGMSMSMDMGEAMGGSSSTKMVMNMKMTLAK